MDHEVPATTPLINFWRYVRERAALDDKHHPLLVHCRFVINIYLRGLLFMKKFLPQIKSKPLKPLLKYCS
jgi:hypothetical protein